MNSVAAEQKLYQACELLFGPKLELNPGFLDYLQLSGVKCAYRQRALETHPDRLVALSQATNGKQSGLAFHEVQQAYQNLVLYLTEREKRARLVDLTASPYRQSCPAPVDFGNYRRRYPKSHYYPNWSKDKENAAATRSYSHLDALYQGPLPNCRLPLGRFLYYSGFISWRTIAQALAWQHSRRPRLGELSRRLGLLSAEHVAFVLQSKRFNQSFGATAQGLGLLTEAQLKLLLGLQKRLQPRFGEYLLAEKILSSGKLASLLELSRRHNRRQDSELFGVDHFRPFKL